MPSLLEYTRRLLVFLITIEIIITLRHFSYFCSEHCLYSMSENFHQFAFLKDCRLWQLFALELLLLEVLLPVKEYLRVRQFQFL